ncbi:DNA-binding protein [Terrimonas sp.]|nr:DNA-binding protein [Terrimonas sp.]
MGGEDKKHAFFHLKIILLYGKGFSFMYFSSAILKHRMGIIYAIQKRIYRIRRKTVILDIDLALIYNIEPKIFRQEVKRNIQHFPGGCLFQLTEKEWETLRSAINATHNGILHQADNLAQTPYAFTEQGVVALNAVLHNNLVVKMNIAIIRAFAETGKGSRH